MTADPTAAKAGHAAAQDEAVPPPPDAAPPVSADRSVWLIWGGVMLVAVAILPFAARSQDVVRAIATLCGFPVG